MCECEKISPDCSITKRLFDELPVVCSYPAPLNSMTTTPEPPSTHQKALQINLDAAKHGTFAEIGAGQEVARWFFQVGGAAGTVAKTISAYDMTISDAIYGPAPRYVSRQRLQTMLEYEYNLLCERLDEKRGATTKFFVYANTMATRSYSRRDEGHGWMGIQFQHEPRAKPSQIIFHAGLFDTENAREQEAVGRLGVNLVWGAFALHNDPITLIGSLMDGLTRDRIEVDMIRFAGPCFANVDNRLMSLQLVEQGFTDAAMFTADGEVVQPTDALYKKPILIERGSFRPVTNLTMAILAAAQTHFPAGESPEVIMEMTLRQLQTGDRIDHKDFLARVDILGALGQTVMISNYRRYHRLVPFLRRLTAKRIGFAMGLRNLAELFDEQFYVDVPGGIFQALGELFQGDLKLAICPAIDPTTGQIVTPENFQVAPHLRHLYAHLLDNQLVESMAVDESLLKIYSRDVLAKIQSGDPAWESMVPAAGVQLIKQRGFFKA
jgi:hypothetical protein